MKYHHSPHVYVLYLYPTNPFRQIKGPISPHLIQSTGDDAAVSSSVAVDPLEQPPARWLYYTSATAGGIKSTSELGHFTRHLDLGLPPLIALPSRPSQVQQTGHVAGHGLGGMPTGDGDWRLPRQLQRPGQWPDRATTVSSRVSPTRVHGEVACPGPPLAWPARGFSKCGIDSRGTASHWHHAPIIDQNLYFAPQCTLSCACF